MNLAPLVTYLQPNSQRQQHRACLPQIHRLTTVSVYSFCDLGLGKAKMQGMPASNMNLCLPLTLLPHKDTLGRCQFVSSTKSLYLPLSIFFLSLASPHNLVKCPPLPHTRTLIKKTKILSLA